jgi:hypothetical protein
MSPLRLLCGRVGLVAVIAALVIALLPATVRAVTPDELVELSRAGLGDEVLVALIEATGMPSPLGAEEARRLKTEGLSDAVIAAAVHASNATRPGPEPEPVPNVAVIGSAPESPVVVEREIVFVPWLVPVRKPGRVPRPPTPYFNGDRGFGRFINDGAAAPAPVASPDSRR